MMKEKIQSVVALRALAFLGIFLLHVGCPFHWSNFGVATFFVLSGFLLSYRYQDTEILGGWKGGLKFAARHIQKIYPLHIVTMILIIILDVVGLIVTHTTSMLEFGKIGFKVFLNVLLLQSWFPSVSINVSLNGVAWFLSSILFGYFLFPTVKTWLKRIENENSKVLLAAIGILIIQLGITSVLIMMNVKDDIFRWATYDAPFFRIGDFFIGAIAGELAMCHGRSRIKHGKIPIILVMAAGLVVNCWDIFSSHQSVVSKVFGNYTTIYIPIATVLILLLSVEKTFLANSKALMFIGENSSYYFLIHYAVIKIMKSILRLNRIEPNDHWILILVVASVLTVFLTEFYKRRIEGSLMKVNNGFVKGLFKLE